MQNLNQSHREELEAKIINPILDGKIENVSFLKSEMFENPLFKKVYEVFNKSFQKGLKTDLFLEEKNFEPEEFQNLMNFQAKSGMAGYVLLEDYGKQLVWINKRESAKKALEKVLMSLDNSDLTDLADAKEEFMTATDILASADDYKTLNHFASKRMLAVEDYIKTGIDNTMISSGYREFDFLFGGFAKSELSIIAGRPAMGKTMMAQNLAVRMAKNGLSVAFVSLEMAGEILAHRILACESGTPMFEYKQTGTMDSFMNAKKRIADLKIYINDKSSTGINDLVLQARKLVKDKKADVLFVDHLSLLKLETKGVSLSYAVGQITKKLKEIAKENNIPVVLLCQLNRGLEGEANKRPVLQSLRESGEIEQDGDKIFFLYRPEYYLTDSAPEKNTKDYEEKFKIWQDSFLNSKGVMEVICRKNKNYQQGTIKLHCDLPTQKVSDGTY